MNILAYSYIVRDFPMFICREGFHLIDSRNCEQYSCTCAHSQLAYMHTHTYITNTHTHTHTEREI